MSNLVQFFRKWVSEREAHQQKEKKASLMPTAEPLKKTEEFGSAIDRNIVTPKAIVPSSITTKPTDTRRPSAAPSSGIKAVSAPVNNPGLRKRATGVYDVDDNEFVNLDDVELLGKLGYDISAVEYSNLEKTSEALDLYSYVEKIAGVPKEVSKAVDRKEAFSGEFLKDMGYNIPEGYEIKGDLCVPIEKEAAHELKSTNIKSVDYNKENKSLDVEFHSGGTYTYKDVPKSLFDRIRKVKSPGKFFHKHIKKDNKFEHNKLEKEANYQWYMSKPLSERLTAGRPYPFSYLTGETKELIDAVKNRDWENFKEEIGDTTFGAQMLLAQATGLNHPVYADLSKAWAREKVWKDMFGEKGGVYHPDHMRGGSNYAKASKILKAFQSAGIKMDQKEAERLANKYTGGKMEKESAAKRDWYSIPAHVREAIIRAKKGETGAKKDLSDIGYAGGKAAARKKQADSLRRLINKGDELPPKQAFETRSMHPGTLGDFAGTTIFGNNYIPRPLEGEDMVDAFDRVKRQRQTYNLAGQFVGNHPLTQKLGLGGSMLAKTIGGLSTLSPAIGGLLNPFMGNVPQASKTLVDMMNNPSIMSQFKR